MSLNGNLEVFPLEEVLRLLARSRKTGCLRVESGGVQGRIFLNGGGLTLATVAADDELRRRLLAAGLVTEADLRKVELSGSPISECLAPDATPTALSEFVREESVEGLYRIRRSGRGTFDFLVEMTPRYPTGQSYDSEVIVSEADRRSLEWEDVEAVLPSMDLVLRMVPVLEADEAVTLSPSTWRILAALGAGSRIPEIARMVGWSDFRSAREMASLYRNGLVAMTERASATMPAPDLVADPTPMPSGPLPAERTIEESDYDPVVAAGYAPEGEEVEEVEEVDEILPTPSQSGEVSGEVLSEAGRHSAEEPSMEQATPVVITSDEVELAEETVASSYDGGSAWPVAEEPGADAAGTLEAHGNGADSSLTSEPAWAVDTEPEPEDPRAAISSDVLEETSAVDAVADLTPGDGVSSWWSDTPVIADAPVDAAPEPLVEADPVNAPATPWDSSPWSAELPTAEPPATDPLVQSNPWGRWGPGDVTADSATSEAPAEAVSPSTAGPVADTPEPGVDRTGGWWAQTMGGAESQAERPVVDNDADRFLENVFSSLSDENENGPTKSEDEEDETGFGMGLLRRRRMGAAARDISDNNR